MRRSPSQNMLIAFVIGVIGVSAVGAIAWRRPQLPKTVPVTVVAESTQAHFGVLGQDRLTATRVGLGRLSALMSGEVLLERVPPVQLPRVSRQAKIYFEVAPPSTEAWFLTFWYRGNGIDTIRTYDTNRTGSAVERLIPEMTIQPGELFKVWVEPTFEQRTTEFVVTLQRIGVPGDTKHEAGLYGPVTEYHVPLTVVR